MLNVNNEMIKQALEELEQTHHNSNGYSADKVLSVLGIEINGKNKKCIRGKLRSMISKHRYPAFKTAGNDDIVYCLKGKNSGLYRLSKYRKRLYSF